MRLAPLGLVLIAFAVSPAAIPAVAHAGSPAVTVDGKNLARAGGFGRSGGYGRSNPYGRGYRSPYANRYRRSNRGFFTRLMRWVAIGFFLNFLLGSTVGHIVGLMMLALIVALFMRRRRRVYSY